MLFLDKIIFLQSVNLVLFQETPVLLNHNQLPMKFTSFDCSLTRDIKEFFLDISKTFDKVWHEDLLF